ncbi:hypothetical protein DFA_07033 [Cavenderia fasciculata]|uniref:Uncharacterized protein n=1 Tax=Cavenderia fasciculata TaxID=261658 RepID=F4PVB1_CACFS|nr:uncharacterized protein DFA_07033 [Cavenderia fasciculata]EGG19925.1 hypothetical protein DFA_07033 [Cavenderia fasciculata]|eukprot:XP_004366908.1 hypothetical protein DFA_07033 [Cavenderia fasciculata]
MFKLTSNTTTSSSGGGGQASTPDRPLTEASLRQLRYQRERYWSEKGIQAWIDRLYEEADVYIRLQKEKEEAEAAANASGNIESSSSDTSTTTTTNNNITTEDRSNIIEYNNTDKNVNSKAHMDIDNQ